MKEVRIFHPGHALENQTVTLSAEASHHISHVLRMKIEQTLTLFNGENYQCDAIITEIHKKKVCVRILNSQLISRESSLKIHLAQVVSKGERMEWVIQKAVELGVHRIIPLVSERCVIKLDEERFKKKINQWQAIAISACEQSGRNWVPAIHPIQTLDNYLQQSFPYLQFLLHPQSSQHWRNYTPPTGSIGLLVGPEGGFTPNEITAAYAAHFNPLSLGPRVLRTETAAIASISMLQAVWGDL